MNTHRQARCDDDRGAVAIIIALLIVILIVIAAWVIDGSALYQERRELQAGADAAALAIAQDCAQVATCSATGAIYARGQDYVDANAGDGASRIPSGGITFPDANTVRVDVRTDDAGPDKDGDDTTVDFQFARVIGENGREVRAVASASWGAVGSGTTLPITFSICEFNAATAGGTVYASPPFSGAPSIIKFHEGNGNNQPSDCPAWPAGQDNDGDSRLAGGFGWLQTTGTCSAEIDENNWVGAGPGNGNPSNMGCDPDDLLGQTVLIPIFNDLSTAGNNAVCDLGPGGKCYRIEGFAAFHIAGFRFPGGGSWRQNMSAQECPNSTSCLKGHFTRFVLPGDGTGENDFGATSIWLVS